MSGLAPTEPTSLREESTALTVGVCQLGRPASGEDGLARLESLIRQAVEAGARLVVFPELFRVAQRPDPRRGYGPWARPLPEAAAEAAALARRWGIWVVWGSVLERPRRPSTDKPHHVYNTSVAVDPHGRIAAVYRKRRLFRADLPQGRYDESRFFRPGRRGARFDVGVWRFGLSVCFDVRFPALYQADRRKGANVFVIPAAFTRETGAAHWDVLVRARAVENQCYVIAPNMAGEDPFGRPRFGRSLIVDPWGEVLAVSGSGKSDAVLTAVLNIEKIKAVRRRIILA